MPYIFGKLWHLAIIWAIRKAFQCILQAVRFLLANHTRLSPTSENDSYTIHTYCSMDQECKNGKYKSSCVVHLGFRPTSLTVFLATEALCWTGSSVIAKESTFGYATPALMQIVSNQWLLIIVLRWTGSLIITKESQLDTDLCTLEASLLWLALIFCFLIRGRTSVKILFKISRA